MPAVTAFLNAAARREDSTLEEPKARNIEPVPVVGHRKKSKDVASYYVVFITCVRGLNLVRTQVVLVAVVIIPYLF